MIRATRLLRTIVGVMPEGFHFPYDSDIWFTYEFEPLKVKRNWYGVFGRLKEGVSLNQYVATLLSAGDAWTRAEHRQKDAGQEGITSFFENATSRP